MKAWVAAASIVVLLRGVVLAEESIQLPSGTVVHGASLEVRPKWREVFPQGRAFYVEQYASGGLQGMHARDAGLLDGPSVWLHESGRVKTLASYRHGLRQGPVRMWDEDRSLLLISNYKENKKDGVTRLLDDGTTWLVQEWKSGNLVCEGVVDSDSKAGKILDDPQQLAEARKTLAELDELFEETEKGTKQNLRQWFTEWDQRIKGQNAKVVKTVKAADAVTREKQLEKDNFQATRLQAAVVHGANQGTPLGGAAKKLAGPKKKSIPSKIARSLNDSVEAASQQANAVRQEAQRALHNRDAALAEDSQELYEFALASLEKSDAVEETPSAVDKRTPHKKGSRKKGKKR